MSSTSSNAAVQPAGKVHANENENTRAQALAVRVNNLVLSYDKDKKENPIWEAVLLIDEAMHQVNMSKMQNLVEYRQSSEDVSQNALLYMYQNLSGGGYKPYNLCFRKLKARKMDDDNELKTMLLWQEEILNKTIFKNVAAVKAAVTRISKKLNLDLELQIDSVYQIDLYAYQGALTDAYAENHNLTKSQLQEVTKIKMGKKAMTPHYEHLMNRQYVYLDDNNANKDADNVDIRERIPDITKSVEDSVIGDMMAETFYDKIFAENPNLAKNIVYDLLSGRKIKKGVKNFNICQTAIKVLTEMGFEYPDFKEEMGGWMDEQLYNDYCEQEEEKKDRELERNITAFEQCLMED